MCNEVISRNRNVVAAVSFAAAAFGVAFAQANQTATSNISGRILDSTGAAVPNPSVKLTVFGASDLFSETKGDQDGLFRFSTLPPNKYTVRIEVPGFRAFTKTAETISGKDVDLGSIVLEVLPSTWDPAELLEIEVSPQRIFRGRYTNVDYGYSVVIPDGLVGENDPAPAPNHGFGITLSSGTNLWVDASYEAVPYEFGRFNGRLGRLKAERKTWTDTDQGIEHFHQSIVARGFDRRSPIIFTIQLDTTAEHRAEATRAFDALVKSFRTFPVRP